ncbi:hypothetical protein HPB47_019502, partial [Ixodes persulcatus]
MKRGDRALDECSVVCERHSEPRITQRSFRMTISGNVVEIPRDRPLLKKDAIIFQDAPTYFSASLPRRGRNATSAIRCSPIRSEDERTTLQAASGSMLPEAASNDVGLLND